MSVSSNAAEGPPGPARPGTDDTAEAVYLSRELSRLDFYGRVLELARDQDVPLLERAKFLAIFSQFVDEFFQVQVAGLKDQVNAGISSTAPDGRSPAEQVRAIRDKVEDLLAAQAKTFLTDVSPRLAEAGIRLCDWESLDGHDRDYLVQVFQQRIFPVLTPLAVDPAHPF
ncbi:MAG TPA: RNA degradosome polyphosphate kinase, partial [Acidimicrobiales bacterium]|nr:RNA degradosome polyphosphate kinase [Acidimicrobiales bacterium]